jgi:hypothetical protein
LGWLGVKTIFPPAAELPARGQTDALAVVMLDHPLLHAITLLDTPDLDGDQPAHHAQADRVFRWTDAVIFLVTPEKYQMTELRPYYRLAARYGLSSVFVMNKLEDPAALEDYAAQLKEAGVNQSPVYAIPRDDAAIDPPIESRLDALQERLSQLTAPQEPLRQQGLRARLSDLLDRLRDQILLPLRDARREADRIGAELRAMETPAAGVDVNPLTRQLQRRLQQRSVLYLMGPGRMLDRVRQVPGLLARLPRTTWDLLRHGTLSREGSDDLPRDFDRRVPDFRQMLCEQLAVVQSRIDDAVRSSALASQWIQANPEAYAAARLPADTAGSIADQELAELRNWLEKRWNATPRDTAVLKKLLSVLPGGQTLTKWSEAAPYLLAIVVATHHAFFGPVDLMVIGGFSLATWLSEKLSNEVAARTRQTNTRIADRFARLAHQQIEQTTQWLMSQAPATGVLDDLHRRADELQEAMT